MLINAPGAIHVLINNASLPVKLYKKSHLLLFFCGSMATIIWLSNVYRKLVYEMGQSNFLADAGGSILIVACSCSIFWYLGVKTTKSYQLDILFTLLFYEFAEVGSILIPEIGTFDWKDMVGYSIGAFMIWLYYLASGSPSQPIKV